MGAPGEQPDVGHTLDRLGLRVDDVDRMVGRAGEVQHAVGRIGGGRFDLRVDADLDAASVLQRRHVIDVDEAGARADDEGLAGSEIGTGQVRSGLQRRGHLVLLRVDDRDGFVAVVQGNGVLSVVAHVDAPRAATDADFLDDLVFAGVDDADDAEVAVSHVQGSPIQARRGVGAALDLAQRARRIEFGDAGHLAQQNLFQQLVARHVDHADPVRAVVAHIRFRPIGCEGDVERLDQPFDRLDHLERHHVDHGDRVASGVALVIEASVRRKRQVLGREADGNLLDDFKGSRVDDVSGVAAGAAGHEVATVRRHHDHVRIDVLAQEGAADDFFRLDVHERNVVRVAVDDHDDGGGIGDLDRCVRRRRRHRHARHRFGLRARHWRGDDQTAAQNACEPQRLLTDARHGNALLRDQKLACKRIAGSR